MVHDNPGHEMPSSPARKIEFQRRKGTPLAQEFCEFDGKDPRMESQDEVIRDRRNKRDYSSQRLSRQMMESLADGVSLSDFAGLDGFAVASVSQRGVGNCYEVVVFNTDPKAVYDPEKVREEIDLHRGRWRALVSGAITRKRVPDLIFEIMPPGVQP